MDTTQFLQKAELSVTDLAHLRGSKPQPPHMLVDIRESNELLISTLPDSTHIRMHQIPSELHQLPQDKLIIVFCHYGIRSRMVVDFLHQNGFNNAVNLADGIDEWARLIDPDMERY